MRVLTLKPVWAWCVVAAGKRVESRASSTRYRGRLLIHAGRTRAVGAEVVAASDAARQVMGWPPGVLVEDHADPGFVGRHVGWYDDATGAVFDAAPVGHVLASARLAGVHPADHPACRCGPYAMPGMFHWVIDDVVPVPVPVPAVGRLGLWKPGRKLRAAVKSAEG